MALLACPAMRKLQGFGDRKQSQLMDNMVALADGHNVCFLCEFAFLEQLLEDI